MIQNELGDAAQVAANDNSIGTLSWTNPSDALASGGNPSDIEFGSDAISQYLKITDFGFSIPSNATVIGVLAEFRILREVDLVRDESVRLVKGGTILGDNKAFDMVLPGTYQYVAYGGILDTWGLSFTPDDINSSGFGVVFAADGDEDGIINVDHVRITVYYSTPGGVILAASKAGVNVLTAGNPNDFIFHSDYNTFKIIATGTALAQTVNTDPRVFTIAHGLSYTPSVYGFAKFPDGYVAGPNEKERANTSLPVNRYWNIEADATNIYFRFYKGAGSNYDVDVRYYIFETPL